MGIIKRVSEKEYLNIKNKIFPNDESLIEDTDDVHWAYQKLPNWTMRMRYKKGRSPEKLCDEVEYLNGDKQERYNDKIIKQKDKR